MSWLYSTNLELNSTQIADCMSHKGISDVLIAIEININGILTYLLTYSMEQGPS